MQRHDGVRWPGSTSFALGLFLGVVVGLAVLLRSELGWDERTTAELELDAWAQRQGIQIYARTCLDDRARPDGRVPCAVVFAGSIDCSGAGYCGPRRATIWCAGDLAASGGCVWP